MTEARARRRPTKLSAETTWDIFLQVTAGKISQARPRKVLGWKTPAEALDEHLRSLQAAGVASID